MSTTSPSAVTQRLALSLLILRLSLGLFLLLWGLEKFILPDRTVGIFGKFYGLTIEASVTPLIGVLECALAVLFLAGLWRRWTYGLAALVHATSVLASWRSLIDPWGLIYGEVKHLFLAGVPVLAAFVVLYLLREHDLWTIDGRRVAARSSEEQTP